MSEPRLLHVGDLYALRPDLEPRWRVAAILNRGRSYDDVLLEHLTDPTLTSRARVYHPGLNPTDLTLPPSCACWTGRTVPIRDSSSARP